MNQIVLFPYICFKSMVVLVDNRISPMPTLFMLFRYLKQYRMADSERVVWKL